MLSPSLLVFAASLGLCAYVYFGYPALILVLSRLRPRPVRRGEFAARATLVVPAYNEERVIEEKLRNCLALRSPGPLDVLVVSNGSTDGTDAIVRRREGGSLRLLRLEERGKLPALNEGVRRAEGEVVVFSDANALLEPDSLLRLLENFADPEVGGVCGNKTYRPAPGADATEKGEGLYWRYDKWQKGLESRIGSIFAADGALHAVRRRLYVPVSDPAQADDIAISTRVVLQGYRLVYEPGAVAWEEAPAEGREEFRRKVRVTNHSVRALVNLGRALWTSGFYSVELVSHKLLRHLVPFFLIPLFLSNALLAASRPAFSALLALQALFYGLALGGFVLRRTRWGRRRPFAIPYYFCLVNAAALVGVLSIIRGRRLGAWTPRGGLKP